MLLSLKREIWTANTTIGRLWIDGVYYSFTLEDRCRPKGVKVKKETAIPYGTYEVVMDWSEKFQRIMPHIVEVPMFTGIRIHSGNDAIDTEGCPLLGLRKEVDRVLDSKVAFDLFYKRLMTQVGMDPEQGRDLNYWKQMAATERADKIAIVIWSTPPDFHLTL